MRALLLLMAAAIALAGIYRVTVDHKAEFRPSGSDVQVAGCCGRDGYSPDEPRSPEWDSAPS